jgi:hypothetical protein
LAPLFQQYYRQHHCINSSSHQKSRTALTSKYMIGADNLDELDGPKAAPLHHRIVYENDQVRVVETVILAGDTAPLHTHHLKHLLIASSGSHFIRRDAHGIVLRDTRSEDPSFVLPQFQWSDGTPAHTLENTGDDDIRVTAIEIKE